MVTIFKCYGCFYLHLVLHECCIHCYGNCCYSKLLNNKFKKIGCLLCVKPRIYIVDYYNKNKNKNFIVQ